MVSESWFGTAKQRTDIAIKLKRIQNALPKWNVQGSDTKHLYLSRETADGKPVDVTITADGNHFNLSIKKDGQTAVAGGLTASEVIQKLGG